VEILDRVARLEHGDGLPDSRVDEALSRLTVIEQSSGQAGPDSRVTELAARMNSLEKIATGTGADPRVDEMIERLESLEMSAADGAGGSDSRLTEVLARLEIVEQDVQQQVPGVDMDSLMGRLETLENQPHSDAEETMAALRVRQQDMEERLTEVAQTAAKASAATGGITEEERNRLMQWSRETQEQIEELKEQLAQLREFGASGEDSGGVTLGAIQALGDRISEGLVRSTGGGEIKTIKNQMYFVYFTIGMIYAVGGFAAFLYLFKS
jgi:chromosome segregation ATPase